MNQACADLESSLETAFTAWALDTKNAAEILDNFDTMYSCGNGKCSISFEMFFTVANTSATPLSDDKDAQQEICTAFLNFFITEASTTGDWGCKIVKENEQYLIKATYSEGMLNLR